MLDNDKFCKSMEVLDLLTRRKKKMMFKKALLNFLLGYLSPSNKLIIYVSQDLDKLISSYQKSIYKKYIRKSSYRPTLNRVA